MKKVVLLLSQTVAVISCLYSQTKYNINACINGIENDTVYIMYASLDNNETHTDTLLAHHNNFIYTLPINDPVEIAVVPQKSFYKFPSGRIYVPNTKFINLIIKPTDEITITGTISENYLDYNIKGSPLNEIMDSIRNSYKVLDTIAVNYELQSGLLPDNKNKKELSKALFDKRVATTQKISKIKLNYIAQNLNNETSAFLLLKQPLETFGAYYPKLSKDVRNGTFKRVLEKQYLQYQKFIQTNIASKTIKEGNIAPNFSLNDIAGKSFSLTQIKQKYIVLDFWGSWCGWCIKEFPKMKNYYDKYKTQIAFVGIACNDKEVEWKKVVEKYRLDWIQLSSSSKNDISVLYGVHTFPTKIILNQDLEIIGVFNGTDDNFYKKLDTLAE